MCRDALCRPRCKNIRISNLAVARTSEMSEIRLHVPEFAPRARNSRRVPEIRVACPRFALQRHRVMTNLSHIFLSLSPSKYLPFLEPSSRYIYIYITFLTPPDISASEILDRQIRYVYIFIKNKVAGEKVHFNQNLDRNQVHFNRVNQKQVPPQVPRTWQGGHGCAGRGTTGVPPSASESSAGEVVALGLNRSFSKFDSK